MTTLIVLQRVLRPVLYFVVSMVLGVAIGLIGITKFANASPFADIFVVAVVTITGLCGLWTFWLLGAEIEFVRLGYGIRPLPPIEYSRWTIGLKLWVYEEWTAETGMRQLPFVREILGNGYPAPSVVRLPSGNRWETDAPEWARLRRTEIVERICKCAGEKTQVADS